MCTAIAFLNRRGEGVFGRTMDFHHDLDPHLVAFPAGTTWETMLGQRRADRYGVAGIARHAKNLYVMFDGVNEAGLAGGTLYFNGYADFPESARGGAKTRVPALDFLHYALGSCASLKELRAHLSTIALVGVRDGLTGTVAPVHWMFADSEGNSIVIEQTASGMHVYENPVGVLTNSPDFPWQVTNLRNYMEATPGQTAQANWDGFVMRPFGQANGTSSLPGGYTPPARFVRTVYQKLHMTQPEDMQASVIAGLHVLEGVSLPEGVVIASNESYDYTQYTSMIDLRNGVYYFRTNENPQIVRVDVARLWAPGEQGARDAGSIRVPVRFCELGA